MHFCHDCKEDADMLIGSSDGPLRCAICDTRHKGALLDKITAYRPEPPSRGSLSPDAIDVGDWLALIGYSLRLLARLARPSLVEASCTTCSVPLTRLVPADPCSDNRERCASCASDYEREQRRAAHRDAEVACDCGGRAAKSTHSSWCGSGLGPSRLRSGGMVVRSTAPHPGELMAATEERCAIMGPDDTVNIICE